jgi:Polyketide cyclase / dehydrase and lipid transport
MSLFHTALIGLASLGLLAGGALLLPRKVRFERTHEVGGQPAEVLTLAASSAGYQSFNPYADSDPNLEIQLTGPATGVGSGFRFKGKDGEGTQTVVAVGADHVEYQLDLGPMGKPRQELRVKASGTKSEVTWAMEADLGMNPIARVFGLFLESMVAPELERGLKKLDTAVSASS